MFYMKGQSSIEFVLTASIALLLSSPFILSSQESILRLNTASASLQIEDSLRDFDQAANLLEDKSYPARRRIRFDTPSSVNNMYNPQFNNSSALIAQSRTGDTVSNRSVVFDFNVTLNGVNKLVDQGLHELVLKRNSKGVNVSVIS